MEWIESRKSPARPLPSAASPEPVRSKVEYGGTTVHPNLIQSIHCGFFVLHLKSINLMFFKICMIMCRICLGDEVAGGE